MGQMRTDTYNSWQRTDPNDVSARERCYWLDQACLALLGALRHDRDSGKMAASQLEAHRLQGVRLKGNGGA
jgi:hypothetical protein